MPDTSDTNSDAQAVAQGDSAVVTAPAQATAQGGNGPWAQKLAAAFADDLTRAQVDAFLRTEIQPYITSKEQQASQYSKQARLFQDLQESPAETYLAITADLFGDDAVDQVITLLTGDDDDDDGLPDMDTTPAQLPPEVTEMLNDWTASKQKSAYDAELARIKAVPGNENINDELFHPFVVSAEGDFDAAAEGYRQWTQQWAPIANVQTEPDSPPPTMGSDTSVNPAPPTQQHYSNLDDALDSMFNDLKASNAPPVVGGV